MRLVSMTEFILQQIELDKVEVTIVRPSVLLDEIRNYAKFINQHLTLGMFVPCDKEGKVLEDPDNPNSNLSPAGLTVKNREIYKKAKEKVLFEGVVLNDCGYSYGTDKNGFWLEAEYPLTCIESLCYSDVVLTDAAVKQIGL